MNLKVSKIPLILKGNLKSLDIKAEVMGIKQLTFHQIDQLSILWGVDSLYFCQWFIDFNLDTVQDFDCEWALEPFEALGADYE